MGWHRFNRDEEIADLVVVVAVRDIYGVGGIRIILLVDRVCRLSCSAGLAAGGMGNRGVVPAWKFGKTAGGEERTGTKEEERETGYNF